MYFFHRLYFIKIRRLIAFFLAKITDLLMILMQIERDYFFDI
jgi:hypothetical protein